MKMEIDYSSKENGLWIYVISLVESSLPMEWFFRELKKHNHQVLIVFLNPKQPYLMEVLVKNGYRCLFLPY